MLLLPLCLGELLLAEVLVKEFSGGEGLIGSGGSDFYFPCGDFVGVLVIEFADGRVVEWLWFGKGLLWLFSILLTHININYLCFKWTATSDLIRLSPNHTNLAITHS